MSSVSQQIESSREEQLPKKDGGKDRMKRNRHLLGKMELHTCVERQDRQARGMAVARSIMSSSPEVISFFYILISLDTYGTHTHTHTAESAKESMLWKPHSVTWMYFQNNLGQIFLAHMANACRAMRTQQRADVGRRATSDRKGQLAFKCAVGAKYGI